MWVKEGGSDYNGYNFFLFFFTQLGVAKKQTNKKIPFALDTLRTPPHLIWLLGFATAIKVHSYISAPKFT